MTKKEQPERPKPRLEVVHRSEEIKLNDNETFEVDPLYILNSGISFDDPELQAEINKLRVLFKSAKTSEEQKLVLLQVAGLMS